MTKGDMIRLGGNRALAEFQQQNTCLNCAYYNSIVGHHEFCDCPQDKDCVDGVEAWLDEPAESEGGGKMIKECPFCGSIRIVETLKGDKSICLACESFLDDESKPTVFQQITTSPEVLAPKLVYQGFDGGFYSSIIEDGTKEFPYEAEAFAATVARLKEVCDAEKVR